MKQEVVMTLTSAKKLQKKMPWKRIFFDKVHNCYRLIDPTKVYEYQGEEGHDHKRKEEDAQNLVPIHSS